MSRRLFPGAVLLAFVASSWQPAAAQTPTPTLSQQWGLSVFPAKGQDRATQDKDETDCYQWSKQNTGIDPLAPPKAAEPAATQEPKGQAVRGAARGAAAGAAIGAVAGDPGKGAAVGATAGGIGGVAQKRRDKENAKQQAAAQQQQAAEQTKTNFNKGFSACLEGKGYTVK
jgi:Glycine-zipper domain